MRHYESWAAPMPRSQNEWLAEQARKEDAERAVVLDFKERKRFRKPVLVSMTDAQLDAMEAYMRKECGAV